MIKNHQFATTPSFYNIIFLYFYISIFPSTNFTAVPPISTSIFSFFNAFGSE